MNVRKSKFLTLILLLSFVLVLPGISIAAPDVTVKINGVTVSFPDQKPYIDSNDRTLVPMRAPIEALGATVDWDNVARQAIFEKDGTKVVFTIGSKTYTVNGSNRTMDTQAVITGDRTCIPIRYAAEAICATVGWDGTTRTVMILTKASVVSNTLSAEKIAEMKAIPYEKTPGAPIGDSRVYTAPGCSDTYQGMLDSITLQPNQNFITSRELLYMYDGSPGGTGWFCLRGVLQTTNADGSITERDVEAYNYYGGTSLQDGWHWLTPVFIDARTYQPI